MELLQQVRVIDPEPGIDRLSDVLIVEGKIRQIEKQITDYPAQTQVISGQNLILGTGLVDLYSHSGEPGNETRETLLDLAQGAAAGGFTQVGILPDTQPRIDSRQTLTAVIQKSNSIASSCIALPITSLGFWGASGSSSGQQMSEFADLKEAIGLSDRYNLSNLNLLKQVLEYIQPEQKTLAIALDNNELAGGGVVREGANSVRYGMSGNPGFSEAAIIAAVLEIVATIPTPVHIMRVSTQRGVELIAAAKERGVPVTASTTWMHLLWNDDAIGSYDPNLRLEPPLGSQQDREALIAGIKQGIIDAIAIDHQAYNYEEKTVAFALAPPGAIGLELALPLLWQKLVVSGRLEPLELWQALSSNPLQCLQQQPYRIASGQNANLVLFEPQKTWQANRANLTTPAINTPYYEREIMGKVIKTWIAQRS